MARADGLRRAAAGLVAVAVTALVLVPLLTMVRTVWVEGRGRRAETLAAPGLGAAVEHTLVLAAVVTAAAVPLGTLFALALRRPDVPLRSFLRFAVLLPVVVPDFVLGYSWVRAYGRAGFTDDLLGLRWPGLQGPVGVAVVVVVNAVPLAYLVLTAGLATRAEPALERAARASGAGPATVLRTVTLPLLRPALAAASVLVFVLTLGTFAIPLVLGSPAGFSTVTTRVYSNLARSSDPGAFLEAITLALLLVVIAVLVVVPADVLVGPRLRSVRAPTHDRPVGGARSPAGRWTAAAVLGYLALTLGVPLVALVTTALTRAVGLAPTPANWTLANFSDALTTRNAAALGRSLVLAFTAACILVLLGACVAALERGRRGRGIASLVTLTLVLPGSTLAVGMLVAYGRWIGGSAAIILMAYVAKLWAFAHRPVSGALDRLPPDELHASRVSGATLVTGVRTVLLRPLGPALLAGWLVCFLTALHEVTMSTLLYGPDSETFAVVVLNSEELGRVGATAALSVILTVLLVVPAGGAWMLGRRRGRRRGRGRGRGLGGPRPRAAAEVADAR